MSQAAADFDYEKLNTMIPVQQHERDGRSAIRSEEVMDLVEVCVRRINDIDTEAAISSAAHRGVSYSIHRIVFAKKRRVVNKRFSLPYWCGK